MQKTVAILQSNYIPWKGYFDLIAAADEFIFYDEAQYTKNDWRNRNRLKTPQGLAWLTIPVRQERLGQKISETRVANANWGIKHWQTLQQHYSRAPYFHCYREGLEALYQAPGSEFLSAINYRFIELICGWLGISTPLSRVSDYAIGDGQTERLVQLVQAAGGTECLTGPAAKAYLREDLFTTAGLQVRWMDYGGYPTYPQRHGPFAHGVSILDLLFHTGPEAPRYMKFAPLPPFVTRYSAPGSLTI